MECQYCQKKFSTKYILCSHQKTARYCLKLQNKTPEKEHKCEGCNKTFTIVYDLNIHRKKCIVKNNLYQFQRIVEDQKHKITTLEYKLENYKNINNENKTLKDKVEELQSVIIQIATYSTSNDKDKIKQLTDKYVKRRERKQYTEQNVIYVLTTPALKKDRRYILGKATNLTNRLSTYNKTDEHEVIFYKSCGSKEDMNMVEPMVFKKLDEMREQANRERFILPDDKGTDFFIRTIEDCINFIS